MQRALSILNEDRAGKHGHHKNAIVPNGKGIPIAFPWGESFHFPLFSPGQPHKAEKENSTYNSG
jgi:hypothetical protein